MSKRPFSLGVVVQTTTTCESGFLFYDGGCGVHSENLDEAGRLLKELPQVRWINVFSFPAMKEKEPYVYTMPEGFMLDDSVPAWWRLLGILNGFWLNHLPFYASNEWIQKRLRCSEPTVTSAVKKLEEMGLIRCVRKGRNSRSILPCKLQADPNQLGLQPKPTWATDPNQLGHNADSNTDNITPAKAETEIRAVKLDKEGNEVQPKSRQTSVYEPLLKWAEEVSERKFVNRTRQYGALKRAREAGLKSAQLKERWQEMEGEEFWQNKGFDWTNVVASFDRK